MIDFSGIHDLHGLDNITIQDTHYATSRKVAGLIPDEVNF
jgi:hypothetical protein